MDSREERVVAAGSGDAGQIKYWTERVRMKESMGIKRFTGQLMGEHVEMGHWICEPNIV